MSEWQPIETAPVGVRGLVWVADGGAKWSSPHAFGTVREFKPYSDGVYTPEPPKRYVTAEGYSGSWKITHWMPLPEPPK